MKKSREIIIITLFVIALVTIGVLWFKPVGAVGVKAYSEIEIKAEETTAKPVEVEKEEPQALSFSSVEEAKNYVKDYAENKGYDFNAYPEKLFELMVKDSEAIDYALDYPAEIEREHSFSLEKQEYDMPPLFLQWDKRWGYHKFKNGVVGLDGCGATCLSMAAVYLTGDVSLTPDAIADYAADNGYFVDGSGTSWDLFSRGVKHYDLSSRSLGVSKAQLISALDKGHPVIASVRKGDFTKKGHYILIAGYENDAFIVNDPFSVVNSEKTWDWERLSPQIKTMWEIYL